eukprot:g11311.t1
MGGGCLQLHVPVPYHETTFDGQNDLRYLICETACAAECERLVGAADDDLLKKKPEKLNLHLPEGFVRSVGGRKNDKMVIRGADQVQQVREQLREVLRLGGGGGGGKVLSQRLHFGTQVARHAVFGYDDRSPARSTTQTETLFALKDELDHEKLHTSLEILHEKLGYGLGFPPEDPEEGGSSENIAHEHEDLQERNKDKEQELQDQRLVTVGTTTSTISPFFAAPVYLYLCKKRCEQGCALQNTVERGLRNQFMVKYHGRWAFLPKFGLHEVLSVLFSLGNMLPHLAFLLYLLSRREGVPSGGGAASAEAGRGEIEMKMAEIKEGESKISSSSQDQHLPAELLRGSELRQRGGAVDHQMTNKDGGMESVDELKQSVCKNFYRDFPGSDIFRFYWRFWHLMGVNVFIQSALFHGFETPLTLFLDVFSVQLTFLVALLMSRRFHLLAQAHERLLQLELTAKGGDEHRTENSRTSTTLLSRGGWRSEVRSVILPSFLVALAFNLCVDKDVVPPVAVGIVLGGLSGMVFLALPLLRKPFRPLLYRSPALLVVLLGPFPLAAAFEVLDFPPSEFGYLLDAHATWHLSTIPLQCYWWKVFALLEDCFRENWNRGIAGGRRASAQRGDLQIC